MEIYLRALCAEDYKLTYLWRNDREITDLLGGNTYFVSEEREKKWVENSILSDRINLHLIICLQTNNQPIGMVNLANIDYLNRKTAFSIQIGAKDYHGKGIGKQATQLALEHAFYQLNLNKIYLTVLKDNERAIKLYKSMNFSADGTLREELYKNGKFHSLIIMSILRSEFNV